MYVGRTGLDLRTLLLVGEKLAEFGAVLVVELLKVSVIDGELLCAHFGGYGLTVGS